MPTTSTIPLALKLLLKRLKTCLLRLSRETKIPRERLVEIYEKGDPTGPELYTLLEALGPPLVDYLAAAIGQRRAEWVVTKLQIQIGIANQAGKRNKQHNDFSNHYHNHLHYHLHGMNEPPPKALGVSPQRQEVQQVQPGGVVRQIGQPTQLGGQVRQMGAVVAERELGKAA